MPSLNFVKSPSHTSDSMAESFCLIEHHDLLDDNESLQEIQRNGHRYKESFESDDESLSSAEDETLLRAVEGDGEEDSSFTFVVRDVGRMRKRSSTGDGAKDGGTNVNDGKPHQHRTSSGSSRSRRTAKEEVGKELSPKPELDRPEPSPKQRNVTEYRVWTDRLGKHEQDMLFLGCEGQHILLRKRNGVRLKVLKSDLSQKDLDFVARAIQSPAPPAINSPKELLQTITNDTSTVPPKYANKPKPDPSKVRSWLDITGRYSIDAQLLGFRKGKIVLHKTNGVKIGVTPEQMAKEDLVFAEKELGMSLSGCPSRVKKGKVSA